MSSTHKWMGAASVAVIALASASAASAQDAAAPQPAASQQDAPTQVGEVVVTGIRASQREALAVKQSSDKVVEAISAKEIGVLPDVTIAESIARLPGISATRDRGNDSQAVVRGLGARLVLGTINGREVASSEPDRNVRWEIYPSEVVSGVEVYKSQSADLIAGGVAATINISTLDPMDYRGPTFTVRGGPVYYDGGKDIPNYDRTGYRFSGAFVHRLTDDLAIVLAVTAQDQKNGYPSFTGWGYNDSVARPPPGASDYTGDLNGDGVPDPTPWGAQISVSRIDEKREGFSGGLTWRPTDNFRLKADALYSKIWIRERQDQTVYGRNNWGNWNDGSWGVYNDPSAHYTLVDGDVVAATLPYSSVTTVIANYSEDKDLFVGGLNGRWTSENWTITGDLSYSQAKRVNRWEAVRAEAYPTSTTWDTRDGVVPTVTTSQPTISIPNYANQTGESDGPEHLNDELKAAALDLSRDLGTGFFRSLDFGGRVSDRVKHHEYMALYLSGNGSVVPANLFTAYNIGADNLPAILTGDFDAIANAAYGPNAFDLSKATEDLAQHWRVHEKVAEGYVKANFASDALGPSLSGNVGVRVVHVKSTSDGYRQATGSDPLTAASVSNDYTDVLPSANFKFDFGEGRLIRFGLAKVIARPPLDELRASRTLTSYQPYTGNAGNPDLEPFKANQADLSFEWYFHDQALVALSTYYKDVKSYIGWKQTPMAFGGTTYAVASPVNGGSGHIEGAELTFQTPFFFLPPVVQKFGIYSNYAVVSSNLHEFSPVNNPLPLVGLAHDTATVDLWYADHGLEARLGWKYHSPMTVIYGWNGAQLETLEKESTLDFSSSYQITKQVGVRFQVNNLTNEPLRMYMDNRPNRIGRYDVYGRRYLVDVTLRF